MQGGWLTTDVNESYFGEGVGREMVGYGRRPPCRVGGSEQTKWWTALLDDSYGSRIGVGFVAIAGFYRQRSVILTKWSGVLSSCGPGQARITRGWKPGSSQPVGRWRSCRTRDCFLKRKVAFFIHATARDRCRPSAKRGPLIRAAFIPFFENAVPGYR